MKKCIAFCLFLVIVIGCGQNEQQASKVERDTTITPATSYTELFFDSIALEKFINAHPMHDSLAVDIRNFYIGRNYQYAWFLPEGIADYASTFLGMQNSYISYSGDSSIYNFSLQQAVDSLSMDSTALMADTSVLSTELMLTMQFFRYSYKAYTGNRNINTKDLSWYIPRKKINPVSLLDSVLANKGKNFSQYEPVNRQYNLLKGFLLKYYEIQKRGDWDSIQSDKKSYRENQSSPVIAAIKHRLYILGDLTDNDTSSIFTEQTTDAVKKFQRRYGLKEDGVAGSALIKEMNRPIEQRIRQLLINMERMRWVPAEPTGSYLLVNIPEFRLHVFENTRLAFSMNVVVGSTAHNTVVFNGDMKYVVFSPYWNVPPSIIKNEILPGMQRNKNYLVRHNMEWNNGAVRQKPGPGNSLGLVKFLFPNSYNIYLHDTPSKNLFNESKRAFSHGCIRLAEPKRLASYLLRNDSTWTENKITAAMNAGKEKYVTLQQTIPVFIGYFTAWVNSKGELNFRDDIYGHDKEMADQLFANK